MAPLVGPGPDGPVPLCGVEPDAEDFGGGPAHVAAGALPANLPERVINPQSHDRLDILVAYTATAAENWAYLGGPVAAIRHAVDYMKMVFRNNRIEVEPHLVHIAQASTALDRAGRDLGLHIAQRKRLSRAMGFDGDLLRLRHEHQADFVHVFTGERALLLDVCGTHSVAIEDLAAQARLVEYILIDGWTTNHPLHCPDYAVTFVHEVGHGLGADHDPANASGSGRRRYAFGHADRDVVPSLGTAMSYEGQVEPFFSSPHIRPWGAILGIADERDNERVLQEFVHIGARYSDYLRSLEGVPAPPSDLRARFEGDVAHLTWRDNAPDADGYEVFYQWPIGPGLADSRRLIVEGRDGAVIPLEVTLPGADYRFEVRATKGDVRSLRSNAVVMFVPGELVAAPSDVSATVDLHAGYVDVQWTDNSDNESWFDVQLLQDGEPIHRERVSADSERAEIWGFWVEVEHGAEYGVRVFAYNSSGYSESSEVANFRWERPDGPGPVTGVSVRATGPTSVRVAWTPRPEADVYDVHALLPSWSAKREWRKHRDAGSPRVDFEGLPRGGRYLFQIRPAKVPTVGGVPYRTALLTLGGRGTGPRAPSDLSWVLEGGRVRLTWKDNSSDELGFEVQYGLLGSGGNVLGVRGPSWQRLLTVPADTESVVSDDRLVIDDRFRFRVFAYNNRGYSVDRSRVQELPLFGGLTATAGDGEVRLAWRLYSAEAVTGMQVRWKATADVPFDDAVDTWRDLPASATAYTVSASRTVRITRSTYGPRRRRARARRRRQWRRRARR